MKPGLLSSFLILASIGLACATRGAPLSPHSPGATPPIDIVVVPFGLAAGTPTPPIDVAEAITAHLSSVERLAPRLVADRPVPPTRKRDVRFDEWRQDGADYLLIGLVAQVHDGGHEVEFHLLDLEAQDAVVELIVASGPDELQHAAIRIAELIRARLPGPVAAAGDPGSATPVLGSR